MGHGDRDTRLTDIRPPGGRVTVLITTAASHRHAAVLDAALTPHRPRLAAWCWHCNTYRGHSGTPGHQVCLTCLTGFTTPACVTTRR